MRGCGVRKKGGLYIEVQLGWGGSPLEDFIIDPPIVVDRQAWNIADIGQSLVERDITCGQCGGSGKIAIMGGPAVEAIAHHIVNVETGGAKEGAQCGRCHGAGRYRACHIIDVVGRKYYPNVADCLEEGRTQGFSRRCALASAKDFSRLNSQSRIILAHARAHISNFGDYVGAMSADEARAFRCPHRLTAHVPPTGAKPHERGLEEMCGGLWYEDIEAGEGVTPPATPVESMPRLVRRVTPGVAYTARQRPENVTPRYELALFVSLPISRIVLVDPDGEFEQRAEKARHAHLPFEIVEA